MFKMGQNAGQVPLDMDELRDFPSPPCAVEATFLKQLCQRIHVSNWPLRTQLRFRLEVLCRGLRFLRLCWDLKAKAGTFGFPAGA